MSIPPDLAALVNAEFKVIESTTVETYPAFKVKTIRNTEEPFLNLLKKTKPLNLLPLLRKNHDSLLLIFVPRPATKPKNPLINLLLLVATVATTLIAGYYIAAGFGDPLTNAILFSATILIVLGTHEYGHKLASSRQKTNTTLPYFIPGPPPLGTMGAIIFQDGPAPNRNAAFDVGVSGPVTGFIFAVIASAIGLYFSPVVASSLGTPSLPLIMTLLTSVLGIHPPPGHILVLHPIAFAGLVGLFATWLNLLPASTLDGGHVIHALGGKRIQQIFTIIVIFALGIIGLFTFSLFILFFSTMPYPEPLDNVSQLSTKRKLFIPTLVAIFILCFFA